jgi:hypothetical protein
MSYKVMLNITFACKLPDGMAMPDEDKSLIEYQTTAFIHWALNEYVRKATGIKNFYGASPMQEEREKIHESEIN